MVRKVTIYQLIKIVLVLFMASSQLAMAQIEQQKGVNNKMASGNRIAFIENLLKNSSAARKVKQSNNPAVSDLYDDAWLMYKRAISARDYHDPEVMNEALFHSTELMFRAVRLSEHKQLVDNRKQEEFNRRIESIDALLSAHKRISDEKKLNAQHNKLKEIVHNKVATANELVSKGKITAAYKIADEAYVEIKIAIRKLRNGETLVRSLHFATAKDEYLYELDRNDTHKMLVRILMKDKLKNISLKKRTQAYLDKAKLLRQEAEELAANKDFKAAIKKCEKSTQQYVRAIRASGLYIPG